MDVSDSYVSVHGINITGEVDVQRSIKEVVIKFHDLGFMHGDLRGPNILIRKNFAAETSAVLLLDFDWPGKEGEAFYLRKMNKSLVWAEGVKVTGPITNSKAHDLYMLRHLCPDIDI